MLLDSESTDIVYTNKVMGISANFLQRSMIAAESDWSEHAETPEITVESEEKMIAWRDIWSAGHGVGLIHDVPGVATLAQRLKSEFAAC